MKKLLFALAIAVIALTFTACPKKTTNTVSTDFKGYASNKVQLSSALSVSVRSASSITQAHLDAIDRGLTRAFAIAEAAPLNYSGFFRHESYTVWLWPRSPKCDYPAIYQHWSSGGPSDYDQTGYDKDPLPGRVGLCFAGVQWGLPGMIVVDDLTVLERVTWYEAEHNILQQADPERYTRTLGAEHSHPINGEGPREAAVSIAAPEAVDFDGISIEKGQPIHVVLTR